MRNCGSLLKPKVQAVDTTARTHVGCNSLWLNKVIEQLHYIATSLVASCLPDRVVTSRKTMGSLESQYGFHAR